MIIKEGLEEFAYYVDINNLLKYNNTGEVMDILFDEYRLDSEYYDNDVIIVYAPTEHTLRKFKDALKFMGASNEYIDSVINKDDIKENKKFTYKNMKHGINEDRLMNRRLHEAFRSAHTSSYEINMFGDFDPIFESDDEKKCTCKYNGRLISKMNKNEKREAKAELRSKISDLKKAIKDAIKANKSTKQLEARLEKLQNTLDCLMGKCGEMNESVLSVFKKRALLFESENNDENEENAEDTEDVEDMENTEDTESTENDTENTEAEEYEDVEMKAVVLTVLKKNVETVKNAMIEAGVSEDDINMDNVDDLEDDDKVDVRVEVNSIDALNSYLESVGINLEDELGGEILSDDETPEDDNNSDNASDDENADDDSADDENFDDLFA